MSWQRLYQYARLQGAAQDGVTADAAAQIAGQRGGDGRLVGLRVGGEQGGQGYDQARGAMAALKGAGLGQTLFKGLTDGQAADALDGGGLVVPGLKPHHKATVRRLTV